MLLTLNLPERLHSKCYTKDQLNKDEQKMKQIKSKIAELISISNKVDKDSEENELQYLLGEGSFGKVFYIPKVPNLAFKVMSTKDEIQQIKREITVSKLISQIDNNSTQENGLRIAPHFKAYYCYIDSNKTANFFIVQERFIGNLENGPQDDGDFSFRMKNLAYRMRFYKKLLNGFAVMYSKGYKHCDIKPENIFYGYEGMFAKEDDEEDLGFKPRDYFPVIADFGLTTTTDQLCGGGTLSYYEPNEIHLNMPTLDTFRARIELFALSLSIFQTEALFFYRWFVRNKIIENSNWVPGWVDTIEIPQVIQNDINNSVEEGAFYNLKYLMIFTLERVGTLNNNRQFKFSFNDLQKEMFFYKQVLIYYNSLLNSDKMESVKIQNGQEVNVFAQNNQIYENFLDLLLEMLRDNDMFNGRPSMSDTLKRIDQAAQQSTEIDTLFVQKRKNMMKAKPHEISMASIDHEDNQITSQFII